MKQAFIIWASLAMGYAAGNSKNKIGPVGPQGPVGPMAGPLFSGHTDESNAIRAKVDAP